MRKFGILRLGVPFLFVLALWIACSAPGHAAAADAVWPEALGTEVEYSGKLVLDVSNAAQGYVMARIAEPGKHAFKLRVTYDKGQLMYDLNREALFEPFPLQLGSGEYEIALFENVKGTKYSAEGKVVIDVELEDENAAYLVPNQYVNYELLTAAVQKSDELCGDAAPEDAFRIITDFIASEFAYDFVRAKTVKSGQLPDIDYCYENRMGICQDLSAVMVCMLRVQGVPAKLVIGYADKYYHAWTTSVLDGEDVFFDPTVAVGALKARKYTTERMY